MNWRQEEILKETVYPDSDPVRCFRHRIDTVFTLIHQTKYFHMCTCMCVYRFVPEAEDLRSSSESNSMT